MIRPSALVMSVLMAAVAAGTYFGLGYLPPGLVPGVGATPAEHPDSSGGEAPMTDQGTAEPALPAASDSTASGAETAPATETPSTTEVAAAPAPAGASDYAASEEIERALANEPPPEEELAAAKPTAKPKAEATPAKPAVEPAAETQAAQTSSMPAQSSAAPQSPAATASPSEPAKADSAPAGSASKAAPAASNERTADADAIKQWWPDPSTMPANQLKLRYAGQVQGELAIALLFSDAVNLDTLKQNAVVKTASGTPVSGGQWETGKNPKLAIFRGLEAGRYTVVLAPAIAGTGGFMLGTTLQGPVYVKAP